MTETSTTTSVRVPHRFFASAARVYNAFLDPAQAALFLFATGTGQIVRCEIDARVGGSSPSSIAGMARMWRTPVRLSNWTARVGWSSR